MKTKVIVIYGGSFNPPHIVHGRIVETIMKRFAVCNEIWVMPSADRDDKAMEVSGDDRLKMTEILIREMIPDDEGPKVRVSPLEILRKRLTTTWETISILGSCYPYAIFYFALGTDIVGDIKRKWKNGDRLFNSANFLLFDRPDAALSKKELEALPKNFIYIGEIEGVIGVSSTRIRERVKRGASIEGLTTRGVIDYINEHGLYRKSCNEFPFD